MIVMQSFIPRTLDQVKDYERDMQRIASGKDTEGIYYQTIIGLKNDLSGVRLVPSILDKEEPKINDITKVSPSQSEGLRIDTNNEVSVGEDPNEPNDEESSVSDDSSDNDSDTDVQDHVNNPKCDKVDPKDARKAHKKKVKEEKREARKNKTPKAMKKRKKKLSKDKKR